MTVEELQIIISAKTERVQAQIDRVKEKIAGLQPKKSADVNVTTGNAQGNLKKLQAEIARTQAKIDKLNQKMAGVYEKQDAVVGKYTGMPSLTGMTRDNSLDFMVGNDPQMQKLNAQLDRLDAQTAPLKAHLAETKAQITAAGNAAEPAAEKTRKLGESMRTAGGHIQNAGRSGGTFSRMTSRMLLSMALYRGVAFIFKSISEGIQDMARGNAQANGTMSQLATSALYLKNSIAAALMPALQALTPVINQISDALANVFNNIAMLTARIFNHASTVAIAQRANVNYAATLGKTKKAADDAKRSIMGFDEIHALSKPSSAVSADSNKPGMPAAGTMFKNVKIPQWANDIGAVTDQIGKVISTWWNGLTSSEKWGAGIGGTAGFLIGGIIGKLIGGPIGKLVGSALGAAAGVAVGTWWGTLTAPEKWSVGIGAGAGTVIGGIIGGIIGGPIGIKVGAILGGVIGGLIGKWWADLTTREKWGAGIGAGVGAVIGGIIGGLIAGPIGAVVGAALGGTAGALIGKWWNNLTTKEKWSTGIGAGVGAVIGGIIGTIICPGIGTVLGAALGGVAGTLIGKWWSTLSAKQRWSVGATGIGAVIGGIIGTFICPGIGTVLGAALGGVAGNLINKFWNYLKDKNNWQISAGTGIGTVIGGIIGTIIGGPLGTVIGGYLGGKAGGAIESAIKKHAKGTKYHTGGPALVNDQSGSVYREFIQTPNGSAFIPKGRNVFIPNLPVGTRILPARETKQLFPNYADGIGKFNIDSSIVAPDVQENGISDLYAGFSRTHDSDVSDALAHQLLSEIVDLKKAILERPINLYANDENIATSANRGNQVIDRRNRPVATT